MNSVNQKMYTWVKEVVVGLNLCPFAKRPLEEDSIRFINYETAGEKEMFFSFLDEVEFLQNHLDISTTIVSFPHASSDFREFYDFSLTVEMQLEKLGIHEEFQVVCFHPQFVFEGVEADARANYVNRSPYPMLHLLRNIDIEMAIKSPEEGKKISVNNEKMLNSLDDAQLNKLLTYL